MNKSPFISHTAQCGETITYQLRNLFGVKLITMAVNFNPIDHIVFANAYIPSIPGITRLTSVTIDKGNKGTYSFALSAGYNQSTIMTGIEQEFNTYFLQLTQKAI